MIRKAFGERERESEWDEMRKQNKKMINLVWHKCKLITIVNQLQRSKIKVLIAIT